MKIRPMGAEFHAQDGQTGTMKLTVAFRSSTNAPKSECPIEARSPVFVESVNIVVWYQIIAFRVKQ